MNITTRKQARTSGDDKYFTGKPCIRGHISPRYTRSKMCQSCIREKSLARNVADPEGNRRRVKEWIKNNPDQRREQVRRYKAKNKERLAEKNREYEKQTRERRAERTKLWRMSLPDKGQSYVRNRRALQRNAQGKHSASDIQAILAIQKWKCAYCRTGIKLRFSIDHIVAIKNGGANSRDNLQALCRSCNSRKSSRDPIEFAQSLGLLI